MLTSLSYTGAVSTYNRATCESCSSHLLFPRNENAKKGVNSNSNPSAQESSKRRKSTSKGTPQTPSDGACSKRPKLINGQSKVRKPRIARKLKSRNSVGAKSRMRKNHSRGKQNQQTYKRSFSSTKDTTSWTNVHLGKRDLQSCELDLFMSWAWSKDDIVNLPALAAGNGGVLMYTVSQVVRYNIFRVFSTLSYIFKP